MSDRTFTHDHQWLKPEEDNSITVGITEYAQEQLGDVVYVDLPEKGVPVQAGRHFAVIESVKTASDISIPLSGTVSEINERLADEPELVNNSPLDKGWLIRLDAENADILQELMDDAAYAASIEKLDE